MRRQATVALIAAAATALLTFGAVGPATAAELPPDSGLYALSCERVEGSGLYSVDPADASATLIGSLSTQKCFAGATVDPTTGTTYVTLVDYSVGALLATIDLQTGVYSVIAEFTVGGSGVQPESIAIGGDGTAYAVVLDEIYTLNLEDGTLTYLVDAPFESDGWGFAWDLINEDFLLSHTPTQMIWSFDPGTLAFAEVGSPAYSGYFFQAVQVDSSGALWFSANYFEGRTSLLTGARDSIETPDYVGELATPSGSFYSFVLVIGDPYVPQVPPVPQLAVSGVDATAPAATALLLLVAGAVALMFTRRRAATR